MERQKIIWVIFSVGFVMVALVLIGLLLNKPDDDSAAGRDLSMGTLESTEESETDESGTAGSAEIHDALNNGEDGNTVPFPDEENGSSFDVTDPDKDQEESEDEAIIQYGEDWRNGEKPDTGSAEKQATYHSNATSSGTTRAAEEKPASAAPPVRHTEEPKTVINYWIQLASYTKKSTAETKQEELTEKGLSTTISTKDINGETWYRLRYGPFTSQSEADKFLSWVKNLSGYEEAWRTQVPVTR